MKLPWILFGLLVAMCLVVTVTLTVPEVADGHGAPHRTFARSMQHGGPGLERHERVMELGWMFGMLQIVFFVCCLALGTRSAGGHRRALLAGGVIYGMAFTLMMISYRQYAESGSAGLFLGFPAPTAWMFFALWPAPVFFLVLYVVRFDRWILTSKDMDRFREIVAARRQRGRKAG